MSARALENKILKACASGGKLRAILANVFGHGNKEAPRYNGRATVTSDGFIMCGFTDSNGSRHMGAFVGSYSDLENNLEGLSRFMKLTPAEKDYLLARVAGWIATDYRSKRA